MKSAKMFGLATLAALMAMAIAGVSSAMAESTALCQQDVEVCKTPITHVHETSVGKARLESSLPTIECNALFLGDALNSGLGNPLTIHGTFAYSSCNNLCTVKEENGPTQIDISSLGGDPASVTYWIFLVRIKCPFINCSFEGFLIGGWENGPLWSFASNGDTEIIHQPLIRESEGCVKAVYLDIVTTPLSATYISS